MKVNGEQITLEKDFTVMSYLQEKGFRTDRVAVELNGEILPKKLYEVTYLKDSDSMEIVQFMGGG
ncbi:MAG: sulfur carrier protein ThiS [Hominimerdicola sp.]